MGGYQPAVPKKGVPGGYASVDDTGRVEQTCANMTDTPAPSKVPVSDGGGRLDSWISDASTTGKGKVELATNGETTPGLAVQANDSRLSDPRTPVYHTHFLADITDEGALASKNTVGTADIDNDAVTYAKIQNASSSKILGRQTAGAGDVEEVAPAHSVILDSTGLRLSGDAATPGNNKTYGTDASGVKGWKNDPAGGGAGRNDVTVQYPSTLGTSVVWSNMPAAVTEFVATTVRRFKVDLTGFTKWKFSIEQTVAAASGAKLGLQYSSDGGSTWHAIDSDTANAQSTTAIALLTAAGFPISAEGAIHANAQGIVLIRVVGSAGNGAADPSFRNGLLIFYS